jgi:hypothetical protein
MPTQPTKPKLQTTPTEFTIAVTPGEAVGWEVEGVEGEMAFHVGVPLPVDKITIWLIGAVRVIFGIGFSWFMCACLAHTQTYEASTKGR